MAQQFGPEWMLWLWMGVAVASVFGAILVARSSRPRLSRLSVEHIAAAAIIGVVGWEAAVRVPETIVTVTSGYAGIEGARGQGTYEAFAATLVGSVIGAVVAIVGLLRRRAWAVVLGLGVALARVGTVAIGVSNMLSLTASDPQFAWWSVQVAAGAVPALAAIVLLVLPFMRGTVRPVQAEPSPGVSEPEAEVEPAAETRSPDIMSVEERA